MTTALKLFLSSMTFAIVIAVAYWLVAREIAGALLLAAMAFGLGLIAGYMIFAERDAGLSADRPGADPGDESGVLMGTFTTHTPIPIACAFALTMLVLGIVISPALAAIGVVVLLVLGAFFVTSSR